MTRTPARLRPWPIVWLLAASACQLGDLVNSGSPGRLSVNPLSVSDSAALGSSQGRVQEIAISSEGAAGMQWQATVKGSSAWVDLAKTQDTVPSSLRITLKPSGLAVGTYQDTIEITSPGRNESLRVPLTFSIRACLTTALVSGIAVNDALGGLSCGAPHRPDRRSRLFTFSGSAGDSISLSLTSTAFDAYLILDTNTTRPPVVENDNCNPDTRDACLRYYRLPRTTTYTVEATTQAAGETGPFRLLFARVAPPPTPSELAQLSSDQSTVVPLGGTTRNEAVELRARVSDPDESEWLMLQVELKPVGVAFDGGSLVESAWVPSGTIAAASASGLGQGVAYHWRARVMDPTARVSPWFSYGDNDEESADFRAGPQRAPSAPEALAQFRIDGSTEVGIGGLTVEKTLLLRARVTDPDAADSLWLEAEVQPVGIPFSNVPTTTAAGVPNGATATASAGGLLDYTGYHWQARVRDRAGAMSGWVSFGGNSEGEADFRVVLPPTQIVFLTEPSTTAAGAVISPAVRVAVQDAGGSTLAYFNDPITISLSNNPGAAALSGTTTVSAVNGIATFGDLSLNRTGAGYILAASSSGLPGATSTPFNIVAGAATQLSFTTQPTDVAAGSAIDPPVRVTASDAAGNVASGFAGPITVAIGSNPGAGTLSGTLTAVATAGVATFADLSINRPGAGYTLTAASAGLGGATSATFNVATAPVSPVQSTISAVPGSIAAGSTTAVTVTARDASGNPVSGASVTVTATGTGNTLTPATGLTDASGVFSASFGSTVAESKTLSATVNGVALAASAAVTVAPGPAAQLGFQVQPSNVRVGASISPAVQVVVRDASGNTVTAAAGSVTMSLAPHSGTPVLGGTLTVGLVNGVATFGNLTVNQAGTGYALRANAPGVPQATSASFNVTP